MQGLRTARALILDDRPEEAMPVVNALSRLGVATLYHSGKAENMQGEKLRGVRILFLDMVLKAWGADENDPEQCAKMVTGILAQIVDLGDAPVAAICWTAHKTMAEEFAQAFNAQFPNNCLSKVSVIEKPATADFADVTVLDGIERVVTESLRALEPMSVLLNWEQRVHDSATTTTELLARLVADYCGSDRDNWSNYAFKILASLALAERGHRLRSENGMRALEATFAALNPILEDALAHPRSREVTGDVDALCERLSENVRLASSVKDGEPPFLPVAVRATLNTRIHASDDIQDEEVLPGSLFVLDRGSQNRALARQAGVVDATVTELANDTFFWGNESPNWGDLQQNCVPVMIEVSAACDFAQASTKIHRFVVGFWVKEGPFATKIRREADYLRLVERLLLVRTAGRPAERGCLVFNAHFVTGVSRAAARQLVSFTRLRKEALAAIIFWLASHHSRPGVLEV